MNPFLEILQSKIIPWTLHDAHQHLVVARPEMSAASMPFGAVISPQPIKGKRVIIKDDRKLANQRFTIAKWYEANLHEIALPKLACITNGTADYRLSKYCVHCGEGTFIVIPPRMPHQYMGPFLQDAHLRDGSCSLLQAQAYSHGIYIWCSRSMGEQHTNEMKDNYLIPNRDAVAVLNLLVKEAAEGKENFKFSCGGLLSAFFSIVTREIKEGHYMQPGFGAALETHVNAEKTFTGQLQEFLESNLYKQLTLKGAAAHMYMSTAQFTRRMRQETGTTFVEWVTCARVERAKKLLRETDWTFNAIACFFGFRHPSYFLSIFRQRTGYTPMEYRRRFARNDKPAGKRRKTKKHP